MPVQYADYAQWHRGYAAAEEQERRNYWQNKLGDLPADRGGERTPRPSTLMPVSLPKKVAKNITPFAKREGVTPFMVILNAFQQVLRKERGNEDLVIGTQHLSRDHEEVRELIGSFANLIPLRIQLEDPDQSERLNRIKQTTQEAFAHAMPYGQLCSHMGQNSLFDALFILQGAPSVMKAGGLKLSPYAEGKITELGVDRGRSLYGIALVLGEGKDGFSGYLEYQTDAYSETQAGQFFEEMMEILASEVA